MKIRIAGPKGIAVNRSGHLVVVDNKASCVFVFQPNGKLVQKFGSRGSERNRLAGPQFVAINSEDQIIISDFHNHAIKVSNHCLETYLKNSGNKLVFSQVFESNGDFAFSFGSNGEGECLVSVYVKLFESFKKF